METNGKTTESHGGHRGERSQPPEQELKCMEQVQTLGKERETRAGVKTQHQLKANTQSALSTTGCGALRQDVREEGSCSPE